MLPATPQAVGQNNTPPGQPPMGGAGGASMPTQNQGLQANAMNQLRWVVKILEKTLPMLGAGSDEGKEVLKSLQSLSKIVPPGSGSPSMQQTEMQRMMMQHRTDQPMLELMRKQQGGGQGEGGAPQPMPQQQAA